MDQNSKSHLSSQTPAYSLLNPALNAFSDNCFERDTVLTKLPYENTTDHWVRRVNELCYHTYQKALHYTNSSLDLLTLTEITRKLQEGKQFPLGTYLHTSLDYVKSSFHVTTLRARADNICNASSHFKFSMSPVWLTEQSGSGHS